MPSVKIAPSILSADFGKLNEEIKSIEKYVDLIHVDVMDGHFVPNITIGAPVVRYLKTRLPLDCHLMIENPEKYAEDFYRAGASNITIHREVFSSEKLALKVLQKIKSWGIKASICLNPDKPVKLIKNLIEEVDMVLLMSVFPGFGGQKFRPEVLPKIAELRKKYPKLEIEIDGGINSETAKLAKEAGANILVAGSYIFGAKDRKQAIAKLRN